LEANDKNPNTKSQTLFFGIPKWTFYKKSTLAGFGAEPHGIQPDSCLQPMAGFYGLNPHSAVQYYANRLWR
ncbi:MAG: hypothetical protein U0M20_02830, partial [Christensenellales bacterium]|nr:hypothetical protein [Christensenellales bacterium]